MTWFDLFALLVFMVAMQDIVLGLLSWLFFIVFLKPNNWTFK